jgi:hypothetical protein
VVETRWTSVGGCASSWRGEPGPVACDGAGLRRGADGCGGDALCGAGYGERSPERVNRRNGYREREWDTRVGSIELAVPKLRAGSYFPD